MAETFAGEVRNGVVVFLGSAPPFPEGTKVRVELVPQPDGPKTLAERYAAIIGIAEGLPTDMAQEHDHYIHGTARLAPPDVRRLFSAVWPCEC
jgi:hypothetical protein